MNFLRNLCNLKIILRTYSSIESLNVEKLFLDPSIYRLLQKITDSDPQKVHIFNPTEKVQSSIKLLSNEQLDRMKKRKKDFTNQKLQIPPIKNERQDDVRVLVKDEKLNRFLPGKNKIAFVDIGIKENNRNRIMVIRESNGDLRTVSWEERDRFNQIYFKIPEREIIPPPIFNDENVTRILDEGRYIYLLDLNCIQFEPDDARYIALCHRIYNHINTNYDRLNGIRLLSSTRHFAGLTLFLVTQNNCGNLLLDLLANERFDAAKDLLKLYSLIHPDSEFTKSQRHANRLSKDKFDIFLSFVDKCSVSTTQKSRIEYLIENYRQSNAKELSSASN